MLMVKPTLCEESMVNMGMHAWGDQLRRTKNEQVMEHKS